VCVLCCVVTCTGRAGSRRAFSTDWIACCVGGVVKMLVSFRVVINVGVMDGVVGGGGDVGVYIIRAGRSTRRMDRLLCWWCCKRWWWCAITHSLTHSLTPTHSLPLSLSHTHSLSIHTHTINTHTLYTLHVCTHSIYTRIYIYIIYIYISPYTHTYIYIYTYKHISLPV
jgi:hypothetical protein